MAILVKGGELADKAGSEVNAGSREGKQPLRPAEPSQIDADSTIKTVEAASPDRMDFAWQVQCDGNATPFAKEWLK